MGAEGMCSGDEGDTEKRETHSETCGDSFGHCNRDKVHTTVLSVELKYITDLFISF